MDKDSQPQPTAAEGERRKKAGIAKTMRNNASWVIDALPEIKRFKAAYPEFIGEELRAWLQSNGIEPASPHAWGGLTEALKHMQLIEDTGRIRKMTAPRSHARRSPVWKWTHG